MKSHKFEMEHRWGQRIPCRALVTLSAGAGVGGMGRIRDISSSGAFVEIAVELPLQTRVTLLVLGNESAVRAVEMHVMVVRVERDGVGVEWCEAPAGTICANVGCTTLCGALKR